MPSSHLILCRPLLLPPVLPASESFPMSQLFTWGGQSTGVSALALFLPKNTQDWSLLEWSGWISLQSKGLSRVFSNTTVQKHQFFGAQLSSQSNSHIHTWPQEFIPYLKVVLNLIISLIYPFFSFPIDNTLIQASVSHLGHYNILSVVSFPLVSPPNSFSVYHDRDIFLIHEWLYWATAETLIDFALFFT